MVTIKFTLLTYQITICFRLVESGETAIILICIMYLKHIIIF